MARPEGFEPPTLWFVATHSIQLSYGRTGHLGALDQAKGIIADADLEFDHQPDRTDRNTRRNTRRENYSPSQPNLKFGYVGFQRGYV